MRIKVFLGMALLSLALCSRGQAQTRVLFGAGGGNLSNNTTATVLGAVEKPLGPRFEIDIRDEFSPYERHTPFGTGIANLSRGTGILWASKSTGLTGSFERSSYYVQIHKTAYHVFAGVIFRHQWAGSPTRLEFDYVRQVENQIVNGTEASYLQGGRVAVSTRLGCSGKFCYRLGWEMDGGRILTQGNPQCDGTFGGPITCARQPAVAGGVKAFFTFEFPRYTKTETDAF